jgi:hypothetical protein
MSCYIMLYRVMLYRVMLCHDMLCHVMLRYIMLSYVMLCYVMLLMIILKHKVNDNKNNKVNNDSNNNNLKYKNNLINFIFTGLASKKFLESNSCNVLWFSLIKILDTSEIIFTPEQYENIKTRSEDDMALISSNLTLFQQHLLGKKFVKFSFFLFYHNKLSYQKKLFWFFHV